MIVCIYNLQPKFYVYYSSMRRRKDKQELLEDRLTDFPPLCKYLTPGSIYLEALDLPKVNVITTSIEAIDETGIVASCGIHQCADAIVFATGFETNLGE